MHHWLFKLMLALTPSIIKAHFERRISQLKHEVEFLKTGVRQAFDAEGYRIACANYEELITLTRRQMKMRSRSSRLAGGRPAESRHLRMHFVAGIFRKISRWLSRVAKFLDQRPVVDDAESNGKPQLKLELEK